LVNTSDIRYLEVKEKYISVRHVKGEVIIDETLRELEDEFPIFSLGFAAMPYCQPTMSWVLIKMFKANSVCVRTSWMSSST